MIDSATDEMFGSRSLARARGGSRSVPRILGRPSPTSQSADPKTPFRIALYSVVRFHYYWTNRLKARIDACRSFPCWFRAVWTTAGWIDAFLFDLIRIRGRRKGAGLSRLIGSGERNDANDGDDDDGGSDLLSLYVRFHSIQITLYYSVCEWPVFALALFV